MAGIVFTKRWPLHLQTAHLDEATPCASTQQWREAQPFQALQAQLAAKPTCNWCGLGSSGSRDGMVAILTPAISLQATQFSFCT